MADDGEVGGALEMMKNEELGGEGGGCRNLFGGGVAGV